MNGGDIVIQLSNVIAKLSSEINDLKLENNMLRQEIHRVKNNDQVSQIIKQTIRAIPQKNVPKMLRKFNKKRKQIVIAKIQNLASEKNLTLPEIREIIVEEEELCSKASFYRYVEILKKRNKIETAEINDTEILIPV